MESNKNIRRVPVKYKQNQKKPKNQEEIVPPPEPIPTEVPRFQIDDKKAFAYLEEFGYVVFRDVANEEQIERGRSLAWDHVEDVSNGVLRDDISSWFSTKWPDPFNKGIVTADSVGQSEFLWFVRGLPAVQKIYANIWETEDLITSFDGLCVIRPMQYAPSSKIPMVSGTWYHLDQNGHHKPGKLCVQGFLNFFDSGPDDGGLVVLEKSHTQFNSIFASRPHLKKRDDWIVLQRDKTIWRELKQFPEIKAIKVCVKAGDFVCWDSRTIHSGLVPQKDLPIPTDGTTLPLRRLVAYVCMTPKSRLTKEMIKERQNIFKKGLTTNHWPEDCSSSGNRHSAKPNYKPVLLSENQKKLIPI